MGLLSPKNTLEEATDTVKAARGAVKDVKDAKKVLEKQGWIEKGEAITLETLARVLLAHTINANDVPQKTVNLMTAVAFIITTNLQEGIARGVADSVTELLKHSIATMTADVQANLATHADKLAETAQAQATIAQDMQKTQEGMAESARQAATQVRSYSQVTATHPTTPVHHAPPITHSQMQIQNRERIKRRQVLVDFEKTEELQLEKNGRKDDYTQSC